MGQEGHPRIPVGEKGGIRGMKTGDMKGTRNAVVRERDRHRHIDQHMKSLSKGILIERIRN